MKQPNTERRKRLKRLWGFPVVEDTRVGDVPIMVSPQLLIPNTESMEERFDEVMSGLHLPTCSRLDDYKCKEKWRGVKDLARAEISRAKQDFLKEILPEKIEMGKMIRTFMTPEDDLKAVGWNACIDEILSRSKKILK